MEQKKKPDPQRPPKQWEAVSRQSKALEEIDNLMKSDEPVGEKLRQIVADHSAACDEIGEKLAGSKAIPEGNSLETHPQESRLNQRQNMNPKQKHEYERKRIAAEQNSKSCDTQPEQEDHTVGTFSGEEDHVVRTREEEPVPGDTGDQGGGQN